ncbi:MAG: amidohydrolase [Chitinophagales bacterium]
MQNLKVTIVQSNLIWEDIRKNLEHFDELLNGSEKSDLIILPEMFSTGFTMNNKILAENMQGTAVNWMRKTAASKNAVVTGSLIIEDHEHYFNRLIWMQPDGELLFYDKRHLFSPANEQKYFSAGSRKIFPELEEWKILPLICYDLRFPVWARQSPPFTEQGSHPYDLLIYVASWPDKRIYAWKHLLIARAIENQSYVVGVNRVGNDGEGHYYPGASLMIDPMGKIIFEADEKEQAKTFELSSRAIEDVRERLPFLNDRDEFELRV